MQFLSFGAAFFIAAFVCALPASAFDPRSYRQMPELSEIPSPNLSAEQVKERCIRAFNRRYKGALAQDTSNTDRQHWPGVMFVTFQTEGKVSTGAKSLRPVCDVQYTWKTKFEPGRTSTVHFDGRWLWGRNMIYEVRGDSLVFTRYFGDGRRSWGTFEVE